MRRPIQTSNPRVQRLRESLDASIPALAKELQELAREYNAADLFTATAANTLLLAGAADGSGHGPRPPQLETLAFHLFPLFDLPSGDPIPAVATQRCMELLDKLCTQQTLALLMSEPGDEADEAKEIARKVRAYAHDVRGSAYPKQTLEKIKSVAGKFDGWFADRQGIGPLRLCEILTAISRTHSTYLNSLTPQLKASAQQVEAIWRDAKRTRGRDRTAQQNRLLQMCPDRTTAGVVGYTGFLNGSALSDLPVGRENLVGIGLPPSSDEWDAVIRLLGLTDAARASMSSEIEVRRRPLYLLPDGRVVLADLSHALDTLWDVLDDEARADAKFYTSRYGPRKGQWLEERAAEYMARIFPADSVYRGLTYPDPDHPGGETEADVVVAWGPFLVVVEGKAKQFRLQSQLGDIARLRSDLASNVQEAFEQGRRLLRYIDSCDVPQLTEKHTGRKLTINKSDLRRTYLLAVSLHQFAGLTTQLANLTALRLFGDREYPLAVSVPDLDLISRFCEGPDVFLHYVERRLAVQVEAPHLEVPDELALFGAYLETRLQAERVWARNGNAYDSVYLDGFTEPFDQWVASGGEDEDVKAAIRLNVPEAVRAFLKELRERDDRGARWIAFALLGLPDKLLAEIGRFMDMVAADPPEPGRFRRSVYPHGNTVLSFVATSDVPTEVLCERVRERALMEKYIRKAASSVGFGIALQDRSRPFDCAIWIEGPWQRDEEMERRIEEDRPALPVGGMKLPGPNKPCFCGSGKKYKKCCRDRMERALREPETDR